MNKGLYLTPGFCATARAPATARRLLCPTTYDSNENFSEGRKSPTAGAAVVTETLAQGESGREDFSRGMILRSITTVSPSSSARQCSMVAAYLSRTHSITNLP